MEKYDKFTESLTKYIENVKQVVSSEVWLIIITICISEKVANEKKSVAISLWHPGTQMGLLAVDKDGYLCLWDKTI